MMLQQETARDYVIATGEQHSVREFVDLPPPSWACRCAGRGKASTNMRINDKGEVIVRVDPRYFRPAEVETLLGNPEKAQARIGMDPADYFPGAGNRNGYRGPQAGQT